jgi:hypothetical protein
LSLLDPTLRPAELAELLTTRAGALEARLTELGKAPAGLPRIFLLEDEYVSAIVRAELKWLRSVIADLGSGSLVFPSRAEMLRLATTMGGPSEEAINRMEAELEDAKGGPPAPSANARQKRGSLRTSSRSTPAKKTKGRGA